MAENSFFPITNWSEDDKPREKLMLKGKSVLSDAELIAILIGGHLQTLFKAFMDEKADFELSEWKAYKIVRKNLKKSGSILDKEI